MKRLYIQLFLVAALISSIVYYSYADSATATTMTVGCNYSGGTGANICQQSGNNVNTRSCTATQPSGASGDCLYEGDVVCKAWTNCECPWSGDNGPDFCTAGGNTEKSTIAYNVNWDDDQNDCTCLGKVWVAGTSQCCGDDNNLEGDDDCYQDVGLRVRDGGASIPIAVYRTGVGGSPVKIQDAGSVYMVGVVPVGHAKASRVHIRLPVNGTVALRRVT